LRDALSPRLTRRDVQLKRALLASRWREDLARQFGPQALALWECDVASFDPAIEDDLVRQAELAARYTELLASPQFEFAGERLTLSEMGKFSEYPDRDLRRQAAEVRWGWFGEQQASLDELYGQLVALRHGMARKLGQPNFIPVAYQWMHRTDYGQAEVEQFRREVCEHVVPLTVAIRAQQARDLGIDPLMAWDEGLHDPAGNPRPQGDHDWMLERAGQMFSSLDDDMAAFFAQMRRSWLMDLKSRPGKAGGGYCDSLPDLGLPFIFANFNGSKGDVEVFTHEMGHAYQAYCSRNQPLSDYLWPTAEACEIHSMGLEFLTWPAMEQFFEADAQRFRKLHLIGSLLFLPYACVVDHFQHLAYASPEASSDERAAMWRELERQYLPTLQWGDLAHPASGRRWQAQLHVYLHPFYYIDYALALTCALQLWVLSEQDRAQALTRYRDLCQRGGAEPFAALVQSAGLQSPFAPGCLRDVVAHAAERLKL
jgi:M3 family oligoendopeptidase